MKVFTEFLKNMTKLESEAWDWIVRLDSEEPMSKREKSLLVDWLARGPAHVEKIKQLNDFWNNPILTELVYPSAQKVVEQPKVVNKPKFQFSLLSPAYAFAFTVLLSVFGGAFWWQQASLVNDLSQTYATALGQQSTFNLEDGSRVVLNSDSQLNINYTSKTRDLWLVKGEAHFDVKKDKTRPFNVYAANGRVQAVGTAFSVDLSQSGDLKVLVTEGRISLALANINEANSIENSLANTSNFDIDNAYISQMENVAYMTVGEYTSIDTNFTFEKGKSEIENRIIKLKKDNMDNMLAWTNGEIVFSGETLENVIQQLKRYSSMQIELADPSLASLKVGGRFKVDKIDALLKNLEINLNVKINKTAIDKVIISKNVQS